MRGGFDQFRNITILNIMKQRLFLIKRSDGLWSPANDDSYELAKKMPQGQPIEVKKSNHRILGLHSKFFIMRDFVYNNLSEEFYTIYPNSESFRKAWLILAGHVDIVEIPNGTRHINAATINFEKCRQDEFEQIYSSCVDAAIEHFILDFELQKRLLDLA